MGKIFEHLPFSAELGIPSSYGNARSYMQQVAIITKKVNELIDFINGNLGGGYVPEITEADNGAVLKVSGTSSVWDQTIPETIRSQGTQLESLDRQVVSIIDELIDLTILLTDINAGRV